MTMIAESGLRYRGALRLTVDDATYALKVLARNLPRRPLIGLLYASLTVKLPYTLLGRVPFKFVRDLIRYIHKFHFTWSSRD